MKIYQFKVSIIGIPKLYRTIEVSENCTFDDFHEAIFEAFDRYDEHLYSFFITGKDTKNIRTIIDSPEITHPYNLESKINFGEPKDSKSSTQIQISDVNLKKKDIIHYLFDFGDEWWHRIRVENILETKSRKRIAHIIKAVGEAPPQYPDYDEDYDEDE